MKIQYIIATCMLVCSTNCTGTEVMKHEEKNTPFSHKKMLLPHTAKEFGQKNQPHIHYKSLSLQDELVQKAKSAAKEDEIEEGDIRKALEVREKMIEDIPSLKNKSFSILEGGFLSFENNL